MWCLIAALGRGPDCRFDSPSDRWQAVRIADATARCIGGMRSRLQVRRWNIQVGVSLNCGCKDAVCRLNVVWITDESTQHTGVMWSRFPVQRYDM